MAKVGRTLRPSNSKDNSHNKFNGILMSMNSLGSELSSDINLIPIV
jgi:hypothetical protein